jgi:hypothetical protein
LTSASTYTGSTTINPGVAIIAGSSGVFGAATNPLTVAGGTLVVESGVTIANAISLNTGLVEGSGTLQPSATVQIGTGMTVAPGTGGIGTLTFADSVPSIGNVLSLAGGHYLWEIADATAAAGGWDRINVIGAANIAASSGAPFHFKIQPASSISLLDTIPGFDPYASYSWPVLTATSISGFTGTNQFALDTSHVASMIAGGSFSFSLNAGSNTLLLNFTPVPEPSTYVMLGVGAAVVLLVNRRRRSARG